MIDFDDVSAGTRVDTHYPEVTFPDSAVVLAASDVGLSTKSPPNLLSKNCSEFDEPPLTIRFTDPQALVRVHVGNAFPFPQRAVLRAYNAAVGGNLVGSTELTLGGQAGVSVPLEICRALDGDIRRVELQVGTAACELIDDLTFADSADLGPITTVDFDDRPETTRITRQYPGLDFIDAPWVVQAVSLGTATISPPNLLEPYSAGAEFHPGPLRVVLDPPQAWVRTFVGARVASRVEMRAYSTASGGTPVARVFVDFTGSATVRTPLEICRLAEGDIRRIEIHNDHQLFETIDDFQFAGMVPPSPPPDSEPPRVFIAHPRDGSFFFDEHIPLRGRILENVGLEQVTLIHQQLDGPGRREDPTFLRFVQGGAPNFEFESALTLFPGRNRIRIEATDLAGNRATNLEREVIATLAPPMTVTIDRPVHIPGGAPPVFASPTITVEGRVRKAFGTLPRERLRFRVDSLSAGSRVPAPVDVVSGAPPEFQFRATVPLLSGNIDELNTITIEAETEDGETAADSVPVVFSQPDLSIRAIEARQAAEGSLVADKQTVVRIYPARARWAGGSSVAVRRVELTGSRGGLELPDSPIVRNVPINTLFDLFPLDVFRMNIASSWNITLPSSWDDEGELELTARINTDGGATECGRCGTNNALTQTVTFTRRNAFNVVPVLLSVNGTDIPSITTIAPSFQAVQRLYPTANVNILPSRSLTLRSSDFREINSFDGMGQPTDDAEEAMSELAERIADQYTCYDGDWYGYVFDHIDGCDWDTYFYGLLARFTAARFGTAAGIDAPAAWGFAGVPLRSAAHELGHALGRAHAPGHDEGGPDSRFPDPHGGILRPGFDTSTLVVIPPQQGSGWPAGIPTICDSATCSPGSLHAHDFMSYGGDPFWISPYTWRALFAKNFRGGRSLGTTAGGARSGPASREARAERAVRSRLFLQPTSAGERRFIAVQGRLRDGAVSVLRPFQVGELPPAVRVRDGDGSYRVEVRDPAGNALAAVRFEPAPLTEGRGNIQHFSVVLPLPEGSDHVVILDPAGLILAERQQSANAPVVHLDQPNGGETWSSGGVQNIAWSASDEDGDPLTYALQYSADGGSSWQMIATQLTETSYDAYVTSLPGSNQAMVRVIANDGFHSTRDASDAAFTVASNPPQVAILTPNDGAQLRLEAGGRLSFEGTATDHEDGVLSGDALVWSSDVDGRLGPGRRLDILELSPGTHTISLSATDSDGLEGQAIITVVVSAETIARSVHGLDGWVDNLGTVATKGKVLVGNASLDKEGKEQLIRGFLSFDLSAIPVGARVEGARLEVYQSSVTGTPYRNQAHDREALRHRRVLVDSVVYGDALDPADFDVPRQGAELGTLTDNGLVQYKALEVVVAVQKALDAHQRLMQFRLRLFAEADGDGRQDTGEFEPAFGDERVPRLIISYFVPD